MLELPNVTLCAIACTKVPETVRALRKSMRGIRYADAVLITHENISLEHYGIRTVRIERLDYKAYNHFVMYRLKDHVATDFALIVQNDGYVLRPSRWAKEFLEYDYIGAPWRAGVHFTPSGQEVRVGNGGFSLRSRKLLEAPTALGLAFSDNRTGFFHEDGMLCVHHRETLEAAGMRYAPVELAARFSRERWCAESKLLTFGFHSNRHELFPYLAKRIKKLFRR